MPSKVAYKTALAGVLVLGLTFIFLLRGTTIVNLDKQRLYKFDLDKKSSQRNRPTISQDKQRDIHDDMDKKIPPIDILRNAQPKKCSVDLGSARYYSQSGEDRALYEKYFNSPTQCNGVYLEIGALDGIRYSNTKFYEDHLNWTGVLIEAQPQNAANLKRNRKSSHNVIIPEAVCEEGQNYVNFTGSLAVGGMPDQMEDGHLKHFYRGGVKKLFRVPCRPIGSMLRGAGISAIDLFVLDVEGAELWVMRTMDWTVAIRILVVEMGRGERDRQLVDLLAEHGYTKSDWDIRKHCPPKHDCANNQVFENKNWSPRNI